MSVLTRWFPRRPTGFKMLGEIHITDERRIGICTYTPTSVWNDVVNECIEG